MEFKFTAEDEEFRRELRAFMKAELPDPWEGAGRYPEEDDWDLNVAVRQKMAEKGWLTMHWPEEYGGQCMVSQPFSAIFWRMTRFRSQSSSSG